MDLLSLGLLAALTFAPPERAEVPAGATVAVPQGAPRRPTHHGRHHGPRGGTPAPAALLLLGGMGAGYALLRRRHTGRRDDA